MAVQNKNEEPATLEAGLNFWGRQEQKFQSLFSNEALKDKEFLKIKLRYYDSLWYKYKRAPLDTDGQLMLNMLKFQRKKLEKSLHHGLVRQITRRINTATKSRSALKAQRSTENRNRLERYNQNSPKPETPIPSKEPAVQPIQRSAVKQDRKELSTQEQQSNNTRRKKFYGYNYNTSPRLKRKSGKRLHH